MEVNKIKRTIKSREDKGIRAPMLGARLPKALITSTSWKDGKKLREGRLSLIGIKNRDDTKILKAEELSEEILELNISEKTSYKWCYQK